MMDSAETYEEWHEAALGHDEFTGMEAWKHKSASELYDNVAIEARLRALRNYRMKGDDHALLFTLNEGVHGNMCGMGNAKLYSKAKSGTKQLISDYVDEIADALVYLSRLDDEVISFEEKLDFLHRASHCFGQSALMLSGGAQLGNFHMGVVKALIESDLVPRVISGSSMGAVYAALLGVHTNEELVQYFEPENMMLAVRKEAGLIDRFFERRGSIDIEYIEDSIDRFIPDLTFQEAFLRTGRHINISVAPYEMHQTTRLLNAITSPNVLIRSAVMASTAIPAVFPPVVLSAKNKDGEAQPYLPSRKWVDGSVSDDLPAKRLARLYGVNHYIVSLTNPFALPFASDPSVQSSLLADTSKFAKSWIRELASLGHSVSYKYLKSWPTIGAAASNFHSLVSQNYTGDINIVADFAVIKPRHLLSHLTYDELLGLIRSGERATWPKIETIRVCTKIARVLDDILERFEERELGLAKRAIAASHIA
jgi:predicted acylesterase/phospholipase RssA